jgi:hypothetical protein
MECMKEKSGKHLLHIVVMFSSTVLLAFMAVQPGLEHSNQGGWTRDHISMDVAIANDSCSTA